MKIRDPYPQDELYATLGKHKWRCSRLHELARNMPIIDIPLDHINIYRRLTSDHLRLREFVFHMKAVMDADLTKPIILDEDGELIDGAHRICKALYLKRKTIKAVRFDINPEPDEIEKD